MAIDLSTAGIQVAYCAEATAGTKPTTGWTKLTGIKSIPDFNPEPSSLETTTLDATEYRTYIPGLKDVGGVETDAVFEVDAYVAPTQIEGWDEKPTLT